MARKRMTKTQALEVLENVKREIIDPRADRREAKRALKLVLDNMDDF